MLLYQNSGLVCFLLILLPATAAPSLVSYVALGRFLNLCIPWFPMLKEKRLNNSTHLQGSIIRVPGMQKAPWVFNIIFSQGFPHAISSAGHELDFGFHLADSFSIEVFIHIPSSEGPS
jgi:hypothetical protein